MVIHLTSDTYTTLGAFMVRFNLLDEALACRKFDVSLPTQLLDWCW
jgi:hypothetical protein